MDKAQQQPKRSDRLDIADFDRVLAVNLRGAVLCARAAIRHFLTRPFGRWAATIVMEAE
jgi:glucose 1-dehydrogenase